MVTTFFKIINKSKMIKCNYKSNVTNVSGHKTYMNILTSMSSSLIAVI